MTSWPLPWVTLLLAALVVLHHPHRLTATPLPDPNNQHPVLYMPPRAYLLCWKGVCDPRVWAEMAKRTPFYNFGLGKRSTPGDAYLDTLDEASSLEGANINELDPSLVDDLNDNWPDQTNIKAEKRATKYSFGVGKKNSNDESRRFNFGLGKRQDQQRFSFGLGKRLDSGDHRFSFGLGKREINPNAYYETIPDHDTSNESADDPTNYDSNNNDPINDDPDKRTADRSYSFGLGKRAQAYNFGLGKRPKQTYNFGLGKRAPAYNFGPGKREHAYNFGLGKRGQLYGFGLGKRDRMYGFGLGKRDHDQTGRMYGFGLGKRGGDTTGKMYGFGLGKRGGDTTGKMYGFGLGKRGGDTTGKMYGFGLGKRVDEYDVSGADADGFDDDDYDVKRANPYSFGLGKRSAPDADMTSPGGDDVTFDKRKFSFGLGKRGDERDTAQGASTNEEELSAGTTKSPNYDGQHQHPVESSPHVVDGSHHQ